MLWENYKVLKHVVNMLVLTQLYNASKETSLQHIITQYALLLYVFRNKNHICIINRLIKGNDQFFQQCCLKLLN